MTEWSKMLDISMKTKYINMLHRLGSIPDQTTTWGHTISGRKYCTSPTKQSFGCLRWNLWDFWMKLMSHILNPVWSHVINPRQPLRRVGGYNDCTGYLQFFSPVKHWLHCQWAVSNPGKIHQVKNNLLYGDLQYVDTQSIYMLNWLLHCYHFQVNMSDHA